MFSLLERSCAIQLDVEAAGLPKRIISDEQAEFNFKMISQPEWLYVEAQPDIMYEIEMAIREEGSPGLERGLDRIKIDVPPAMRM
jgi:hypothetical protein